MRERWRRRWTTEYSLISSEALSSLAKSCLILSLPAWSDECALIEPFPKDWDLAERDLRGEDLLGEPKKLESAENESLSELDSVTGCLSISSKFTTFPLSVGWLICEENASSNST